MVENILSLIWIFRSILVFCVVIQFLPDFT